MNYDAITRAVECSAIQPYDQSEEATRERVNIGMGICRGLTVEWLRSKKDNVDFWVSRGTVSEPLLAASNRLVSAAEVQQEYSRTTTSRFVPDAATLAELAKSSVVYSQDDVAASAQFGFAVELPDSQPNKIAAQVLESPSRFFILSMAGSSGCHSIGIHRPYALVGKSSHSFLFDPNVGEIEVSGAANLRALLIALEKLGYSQAGMDLNRSYVLWSYRAT